MSTGPSLKMKRRLNMVIATLLAIGFCIVVFNLGSIALSNNEFYQQKATNQQLRDMQINPKRGTIYDTNMKELAKSATVWNVVLSPNDIKEEDRAAIAKGLAEILDMDEETILEKTKKNNYFEYVSKRVEKPVADEVRAFAQENKFSCIYLFEDSKRYYPLGSFASNVIGFTGDDNQGLYGLEAYYDDVLEGTPGRIVSAKNAWGTDMPYRYEKLYEPQDGNGLVLTIDEALQHFLEKNLETVITQHHVNNRACGIIMDVNTGAVLAMATKGDYDLNNPYEISDPTVKAAIDAIENETERKTALSNAREAQWKNKAITELYEPGSVFKMITGAAAVEENIVEDNWSFTCRSMITIAGTTMKCWTYPRAHGAQNFQEALAHSCNPAFITLGQTLGVSTFYKYLQGFGFTERTGIDLPGEEQSFIYGQESQYGPVELASCSFGQSNKYTPLQMITAMCAVVNGGKLMQPYIVRQIVDSEQNVVENIEPQVKRQVISEETSKVMREALEYVVEANGASNSYIKGYRIGGKSGTSQKLDRNAAETEKTPYTASFAAFAPADDPEIAILVMVDEPMGDDYYGSTVASPVVSAVLQDALPYLGIQPEYSEEDLAEMEATVPYVVGQSPMTASSYLAAQGIRCKVVGEGDTVLRQYPTSGNVMPIDGTVYLYTDSTAPEQVEVPDVKGKSASEANIDLLNANLNIKIVNPTDNVDAKVVSQSIEPGRKCEVGTVVTLTFGEVTSSE